MGADKLLIDTAGRNAELQPFPPLGEGCRGGVEG